MPSYPGIRLALVSPATIERRIAAAAPDVIHIATEGPIGVLARRACLRRVIEKLRERLADDAPMLRRDRRLAREMELLVSSPNEFVPCVFRAETGTGRSP